MNGQTNGHSPPTLEDAKSLLVANGRHAVFLPIEAKGKRPDFKGWPKITYAETLVPGYQERLRALANTGVLLGASSSNLVAIDLDTEAALAAFLALNPAFQTTLRTHGARGGQLWFYGEGERPHQVHALTVDKSSPLAVGCDKPPDKDGKNTIGEFRAEGGQSVIRGIHPSGCHYEWVVPSPPITIAFDAIRWPADIAIPWEQGRKHDTGGQGAADGTLLKQAIAKLTVDWLWTHFGYPDRRTNPVDSPFRTDNTEGHRSFSVYDQGRRFRDHNSSYGYHRGDSFDFYQLATGKGAKEAFAEFVILAGLGGELRKHKDAGSGEHATELELARVLAGTLPPLRCVGEIWYVYQNGFWDKKDKSLFKPRALEIQNERSRKARIAGNVLSHLEFGHQVEQSSLRSFYFINEAGEILLNCQNGVLSVTAQAATLLEHSSDYNFTGQIAAAYDSFAEARVFERVLQEALTEPEDIKLFRAFVGSILLPDSRFEASLCCYGPTGTAKSTLASGVKAALGADLITNLTLQQICDPKCFHLYKLHSAAVNIATELNALAVSSENYKRIISGEAIDADRKYLASVNLETTAKLWFLTNDLPKFVNGTDAELRRLRFLRFVPRKWAIDTTLKGQIANEKDGVFAFMVAGLREVLGMSEMPFGAAYSRRTRERFQVQNDPLGTFVSTCCTLDPKAEEFKSRIGDAYNYFCSDNGIPAALAPEPFFKRLYERYPVHPVRRRDNDQRVQKVLGIALNDD
jgi:P4 family phage/plasmid primase-like protien